MNRYVLRKDKDIFQLSNTLLEHEQAVQDCFGFTGFLLFHM